MTERQALKVSGLLDELRKRAEGMGFSPEQIEPALVVTGLSQGRAKPGKEPFKVLLDFLVKVRAAAYSVAASSPQCVIFVSARNIRRALGGWEVVPHRTRPAACMLDVLPSSEAVRTRFRREPRRG